MPSNRHSNARTQSMHNMLATLARAQDISLGQHRLFAPNQARPNDAERFYLLNQDEVDTLNDALTMLATLNDLATTINQHTQALAYPLPRLVLGNAALLANAIHNALFHSNATLKRLGLQQPFTAGSPTP